MKLCHKLDTHRFGAGAWPRCAARPLAGLPGSSWIQEYFLLRVTPSGNAETCRYRFPEKSRKNEKKILRRSVRCSRAAACRVLSDPPLHSREYLKIFSVTTDSELRGCHAAARGSSISQPISVPGRSARSCNSLYGIPCTSLCATWIILTSRRWCNGTARCTGTRPRQG